MLRCPVLIITLNFFRRTTATTGNNSENSVIFHFRAGRLTQTTDYLFFYVFDINLSSSNTRYIHIFFCTVWRAVIRLSVQIERSMMTDFLTPWWLWLSLINNKFSSNVKNKTVLEMENDLTIFDRPYVSFRFLASTPPVKWLLLCANSSKNATRCRRRTTEYQTPVVYTRRTSLLRQTTGPVTT